jgi:hypothetical protein
VDEAQEPHAFGSTGGTGQVGDFAELPKALGGSEAVMA